MRRTLPCTLLAFAAAAWLLTVGGLTPAFTGYEVEAEPAVRALLAGHLGDFVQLLPAYGGSVVLRAPVALATDWLGGDDVAVFRALAVPCLAAAAWLATAEAVRMRDAGRPRLDRAVLIGLVACNPLTIRALDVGHPEEVLIAAMVIAAALLGLAGRAAWAGVVLGVAIGAKPWAIVAVGPVLLSLAAGRDRALAAGLAGAAAALVLAPMLLGQDGATSAVAVAKDGGIIFQPWQLLWFLGDPGATVLGLNNDVKAGYRGAPGWAGEVTKPLIVGAAALLSLIAWRRGIRREQALGLLAAVLLLRCLLDTWNTDYYGLPFLMALAVWEVRTRARPPVLALAATAATWATTWELRDVVSPDAQAALYLAWSVPLAGWLAWTSSRTAATASDGATSWPWTTSPGALTST